jgi:hypothetical protein
LISIIGDTHSQQQNPQAFLNKAEAVLHEKEKNRRVLDYKVLAKMRNISLGLHSQQPSWVEAR